MLEARLVELVARNFGLDTVRVTPETSTDSVPEWDSVGHLKLILDVEECFGVRFPASEISELISVGKIQAALHRLSR